MIVTVLQTCIEIRLYPYGPQISDRLFEKVDDTSYVIHLGVPVPFIDKIYRKIYVSVNF